MHVVIFRAVLTDAALQDDAYVETAKRLRESAVQDFGCLEFHATSEGRNEIALSYWHDLEAIERWRNAADHVVAQEQGRQRWYQSFTVQIAKVERDYEWAARSE